MPSGAGGAGLGDAAGTDLRDPYGAKESHLKGFGGASGSSCHRLEA